MLISDLSDTLAMVIASGDGKSLEPLTARRAIAAMPFGGSYRIIDFALTNCLHSGLRADSGTYPIQRAVAAKSHPRRLVDLQY